MPRLTIEAGGESTTVLVPGSPLVRFDNPDMSNPDAYISGAAFVPSIFVDEYLSPVKIEYQYGPVKDAAIRPEYGWRPDGTPMDTRTYLFGLSEVASGEVTAAEREASLRDQHFAMQARVTLADGSRVYSEKIRVRARNVSAPVYDVGMYDPKAKYVQRYDTLPIYVNGIRAPHPSGVPGALWGKEGDDRLGPGNGAMSIVADPIPEGVGGHRNHGNVARIRLPLDYGARTANMRSSYSTGSYGPLGDQPTSNPRWSATLPGGIKKGQYRFWGCAWLFPLIPTLKRHFSRGQIMQIPYDQGIVTMEEAKWDDPNHAPPPARMWKMYPSRFCQAEADMLWTEPFYEGVWTDVIFGCKADDRDGWLEAWYRRPDVNDGALTQHRFWDGSTRLWMPNLVNADGILKMDQHLYWAKDSLAEPIVGYIAAQAVGGSPEEVDPHSY